MNRGLSSIFVLSSLIFLAGCTVSVGNGGTGGPFPGETAESLTVQPTFESAPVRENVTLSAGQSRLYRVDISDTVAQNNDVVYFDAVPTDVNKVSGYLEVVAYTVSGNQADELYVSRTNEWFGRPNDPGYNTLSANAEIEPATVGSGTPSCGGPCVVVPTPSAAGTAYIRVKGIQSTTTFDLYVVATPFYDIGEPNDTFAAAETATGSPPFIVGAIEVIGDTDWYVPSTDIESVTFNGNGDLNLLANVYTEGGSFRDTLSDGETYTLPFEQPLQQLRVEVYSDTSQERSGAAGKALYSLEFN
jgi:hypothetical protein